MIETVFTLVQEYPFAVLIVGGLATYALANGVDRVTEQSRNDDGTFGRNLSTSIEDTAKELGVLILLTAASVVTFVVW
jgi:hypothetical protein